jgi:conjugal transfer pilus assembly protein TrbC
VPTDLDGVAGTERARSGEVFRRLEERAPGAALGRAIPSVPVTPGRAPDPAAIAERYRANAASLAPPGSELLVFVSFSMPHASLVRLAEQARQANAVLVFRGLTGATLRQMVERLQPLARTGAAMQINPEAFTRFGIEVVPTFVLTVRNSDCGERACEGPTRRLAGDVSLDHALDRLARSGEPLAQAAETRLRQLREVSR